VIAIIAILAAMLLPALNRARETAKKIKCVANQKQLMTATLMYVDTTRFYPNLNNSNRYGFVGWKWQIAPYLGIETEDNRASTAKANTEIKLARGAFACPSFLLDAGTLLTAAPVFGGGYGYNCYYNSGGMCCGMGYQGIYTSPSLLRHPSSVLTIGDASDRSTSAQQFAVCYQPTYIATIGVGNRHLDTMSVGFADGHAGSLSVPELSKFAEGTTMFYYYWSRKP